MAKHAFRIIAGIMILGLVLGALAPAVLNLGS